MKLSYLFPSCRAVPAGQIESLRVDLYAKKPFPHSLETIFLFPHPRITIIIAGFELTSAVCDSMVKSYCTHLRILDAHHNPA